MERSFPETLSALRREKNISQRKAAADLHISQALLSHYETEPEPGLAFVCKACDYYGVSADYLLCRSELPNRPPEHRRGGQGLPGGDEQPDEQGPPGPWMNSPEKESKNDRPEAYTEIFP